MTRLLYIFALLTLIWTKAQAAYSETYLTTLIEKSEIIVYGKIIAVDDETFSVVSLSKIKTTSKHDTLIIRKFVNWTCAHRYSQYEIGQEAVFFLYKDKDNNLRTMGAANEGELIVKADTAYIADYAQKTFPSKKIDFISKYAHFIIVDLKTLIQGLKIYLDNIDVIEKEVKANNDRTVAYQYSYIDRLPKNYFLSIVLDQKQKGLQ